MDKKFKEFATSKGLKLSNGIAYGNLRGYAATLSDGQGFKQIILSTRFSNSEKQREFEAYVKQKNIFREYGLRDLAFFPENIRITFAYNNAKMLQNIDNFINWFFPLLDEYSASGVNTCSECGEELTGGRWILIDGVACHLHNECAEKLCREIAASDQSRAESETGTYLSGFLGAVIGAALGGILWGLLLFIGYVASIIGFVIGWLAEKGYTLLRGKNGKGKIVVLIFAVIFGVCFGTFFSDCITIVKAGLSVKDIPELFSLLLHDGEYVATSLFNIILGLVFATLGASSLIKRTGNEVSGTKVTYLE